MALVTVFSTLTNVSLKAFSARVTRGQTLRRSVRSDGELCARPCGTTVLVSQSPVAVSALRLRCLFVHGLPGLEGGDVAPAVLAAFASRLRCKAMRTAEL